MTLFWTKLGSNNEIWSENILKKYKNSVTGIPWFIFINHIVLLITNNEEY